MEKEMVVLDLLKKKHNELLSSFFAGIISGAVLFGLLLALGNLF